jgi:allantoin racemase
MARIQLINPLVVDEAMVAYQREFVPDDVDIVGLKKGLRGSMSNMDRNLSDLFDMITSAETQGYDAVVVALFSDLGVEAARELVTIPVLGPLNVGLHVAQMLGHKTLMLSTAYVRFGRFYSRDKIANYGLQDRVVVRGTYRSAPQAIQAYQDYRDTRNVSPFIGEILDICVKSVKEDDVDMIVLGCGGLMWMKELIKEELDKRGYGITVINPLSVTIEMARTLVDLKLGHSRLSYPSMFDSCDWYETTL